MAYHLESLIKVIELILCDDHQRNFFQKKAIKQIKSLLEKACFLRDSFENHAILSQRDNFEDQIRDAAQKAEDVLELYVAYFPTDAGKKILRKFADIARFSNECRTLSRDMQMLLEGFDSLKEEMMEILDVDQNTSADHRAPLAVAPARVEQNPKNILVGFTDDLLQLKDRVFGDSSKLEIIPIVGMGGIGKTTLARKLYDDSSVVSHFDARAWTTVSDDYCLGDILRGLLGDDKTEVEDNLLGLTLYQQLKGQRYIIVLDDIWCSNAWDDVKKYFPINNNGSRIILTTRQSDVANYVDSKTLHHQVRLLSEVDSRELLRNKVFGEEDCLPELEVVAKNIANSCGGLPLAIQVIGGLLLQTERTKNSWEQVASNIISTIAANHKDEQYSCILTLSYNNLPYYLKPCFLYMSAFREDCKIRASTLTRMWIAEGFLKQIQGKSMEEVAEEYLKALINRNLIFVRERNTAGEVKILGIHDLLRELCVLKAREKKFFHVVNGRTDHNASQDMSCMRRVSVLRPSSVDDIYISTRQMQLARSLLDLKLGNEEHETLPHEFSTLRLLSWFEFGNSKAITQAVNLRYLTWHGGQKVDLSITSLRNLQFLILNAHGSIEVPHELFEMPQLREITSWKALLFCDFKKSSKNLNLQENLHTLPTLEITANIEVVLAKFSNLRKLGLYYSHRSHPTFPPISISCLQRIEKLSMMTDYNDSVANYLLDSSFSYTLKSVSLSGFYLPEAFMTKLGMLPNLEILKLNRIWLEDDTENWNWKLAEGKFSRLKYLKLDKVILVNWEGDETHFPILEELRIKGCEQLDELPIAIGEIPTLKTIEVIRSSSAAEAWARQIQERQLDYGNDLLRVLFDDFSSSEYSSDGR